MTPFIARTPSPINLWLLFALSLWATALSGCSENVDTKKEAVLARANGYFAADQYDKAEKEYRELLRLAPADAVAQRQLGIIYHDQQQILQAYPLLKQAAELLPEDLELQLKLGLTYLYGRDYQQARDAALQILRQTARTRTGAFAACRYCGRTR